MTVSCCLLYFSVDKVYWYYVYIKHPNNWLNTTSKQTQQVDEQNKQTEKNKQTIKISRRTKQADYQNNQTNKITRRTKQPDEQNNQTIIKQTPTTQTEPLWYVQMHIYSTVLYWMTIWYLYSVYVCLNDLLIDEEELVVTLTAEM